MINHLSTKAKISEMRIDQGIFTSFLGLKTIDEANYVQEYFVENSNTINEGWWSSKDSTPLYDFIGIILKNN